MTEDISCFEIRDFLTLRYTLKPGHQHVPNLESKGLYF